MEKQEKTPKTKEEKKALVKKIVIWVLCIAVVVLALSRSSYLAAPSMAKTPMASSRSAIGSSSTPSTF
jgi:hypothetical protein